jgi:hypothetical protein
MIHNGGIEFKPVVIESPYGDDDPIEVLMNQVYLRACLRDSLARGEAPFASHGLYALRGVLDDNDPEQRGRGMRAGFAVAELFERRVFYTERGIQDGMIKGAREAHRLGQIIEPRIVGDGSQWGGLLIDVEEWMIERGHTTARSDR